MQVRWLIPTVAVLLTSFAADVSSFITPSDESIKRNRQRSILLPSIASPLGSTTSLNVSSSGRKLVTMGRIPWHKLRLSKKQAGEIVSIIRSETHTLDISIMLILALFSNKIGRFLFEKIFKRYSRYETYEPSITNKIDTNLGQAAWLGLVCYLLDAFEIVLEVAGIKGKKNDFSTIAAKLLTASWIAVRVRLYKRHFFEAAFDYASKLGPNRTNKPVAKVDVVDKITDFFLFGILAFIWIDILNIKRGNALSSVFALGGAGTLALTLALQDLAKRVINSLAISTSDAFEVGDEIMLGDGTSGIVLSVGWLSTVIRGYDEIITKIPNTQLSDIRVSNLSNLKFSQVKQSLYFEFKHLDDMPDFVNELDKAIKSCDKVISDGSRFFLVTWMGYTPKGLEVVVNCKVKYKPGSVAYYAARQEINEIISTVIINRKLEFWKK